MALRMKDVECSVCGKRWEELVQVDEPWNPEHCGQPAKKIFLAPAIKWTAPHFNRGLGMYINDAQHLDRELRKHNLFIPDKNAIARAVENAPGDAVSHLPDPRIGEIAEQVASDLHNIHALEE